MSPTATLDRPIAALTKPGRDWDQGEADPALVEWLNTEAPRALRPGARIAVVGCGLGHDAAEIASRGYDVTAFDRCPETIEEAKTSHPRLAGSFRVDDARTPSGRLRHRFDLVVEAHTLDFAAEQERPPLARGIGELAGPHGVVLAVEHAPSDKRPAGLSPDTLAELMRDAGLAPLCDVRRSPFEDGDRLIACFAHA